MPLNGGDLDTKVVITTPSVTPNAMGDPVETFSTLVTSWAKVVHMKGSELLDAQARVGNVTTKFVVRWSTAMASCDSTCRVEPSESSEVYDIKSVLPIPGGRPEKAEILAMRRDD